MRISVKVDTSAFKGNPMPAVRKGVTKALKNGAEQVRRTAQELAPKDTGFLSESISVEYVAPMRYQVCPHMGPFKYDVYMEEGTPPHGIDGHPLLYWEGAMHPVPHVNHPGTEAYKYMEEAMLANVDFIVALVEAEVDHWLSLQKFKKLYGEL